VAELQYGFEKSAAREKNSLALEAFLLPLEISPFDVDSALVYGKIWTELERQGRSFGGMDLLIAAQAIAQDLTLVTHNLREFTRIQNLRCVTWVEALPNSE
jgi:tRNA(fMet)-specific endonuclease VapC